MKRKPTQHELAVARAMVGQMQAGNVKLDLAMRELTHTPESIAEIMKVIYALDPELVVGTWINDFVHEVYSQDALLAKHPDFEAQLEAIKAEEEDWLTDDENSFLHMRTDNCRRFP